MRLILTILFLFSIAQAQYNNIRGKKATHGPIAGTVTFESEEQSYTASCPPGETGEPETVIIPEGFYTASTQLAANTAAYNKAVDSATSLLDCTPIGTAPDLATYPLLASTNPGLTNPGDPFILNAAATPGSSAPIPAMYNSQVGTNEHLAVSYSAGSTVSNIEIYNGTSVQNGTVSSASNEAGVFRFPITGNKFSVVWLTNSSGKGKAFKVNYPEPKWVLRKVSIGQTASIFGRNLSYNNGTSTSFVWIKNTSTGFFTQCAVTSVNPYMVTYTVPSVANGTYEVWVHRGEGGDYGYSKSPINITVVSASSNVLMKSDWGSISAVPEETATASTNRTNINNAIGTGNRVVTFTLGTYTVSGSINIHSNTRFVGGLSGSGPGTTIRLTSAISNPNEGLFERGAIQADGTVNAAKTMVVFENLIFEANGNSTGADAFIQLVGCSDIVFRNCKIDARLYNALDLRSGNNIHLINTTVIGGASSFGQVVYLSGLSQFFVDGGYYLGTKDCSGAFINMAMKECAVMNCTVGDFNPAATDGTGSMKGRIWSCLLNGGATWDLHFQGITGVDLGVRREGTNVPDNNSGEIFLWEANTTLGKYSATGGGSTTITFASAPSAVANGSHVTITDGPGKGQTRRVISTGTTITVDRPWNVNPTSSSKAQFDYGVDNAVVYANNIDGKYARVLDALNDGTAQSGVEWYGGCYENIAAGNIFNQVRVGMTNFATQHTSTTNDPNYWNVFKYNLVDSFRYGIDITTTTTPQQGNHPHAAVLGAIVEGNVFTNPLSQSILGTSYQANFSYAVQSTKTYTFPIMDMAVIANNVATNSQFYNWWGTDNGQGCDGSYPCAPKTAAPANSTARIINYGNNTGL